MTERERETQITVVPTAGYTYLDLKSMLSRRKAQRRPNSGTSLWIGYGDDGVSRPLFAKVGVSLERLLRLGAL